MKTAIQHQNNRRAECAFTLEEIVTAISLTALCFVGSVQGYSLAASRAEWAACSIAAQSAACQRMEQVRAAKWDTVSYPPIDELVAAKFPVVTDTFDMPLSGTNALNASVTTTINSISTDPPLRIVQVSCIWTNQKARIFTNTLVSYRTPNQ